MCNDIHLLFRVRSVLLSGLLYFSNLSYSIFETMSPQPVSYTHLDVYKRQTINSFISVFTDVLFLGFIQWQLSVLYTRDLNMTRDRPTPRISFII